MERRLGLVNRQVFVNGADLNWGLLSKLGLVLFAFRGRCRSWVAISNA